MKDIKRLEGKEGHTFAAIDYPLQINSTNVKDMWTQLKSKSKWSSVNFLIHYLAISNRSLLYKYKLSKAILRLAEEQQLLGHVAKKMKEDEEKQEIEINRVKKGKDEPEMNVLDKIIAVIFARQIQWNSSSEEHWKQLAALHERIREKWIEEFGSLPPNSIWRENL